MNQDTRRLTIQPYFRWFDMWIGAYYDRKMDVLYLQLLPCIGIKVYIAGEYATHRRASDLHNEE